MTTPKQNVFFTADTHFGHANIIKYCNRPFSTSDEMNRALIQNWNSVVSPNDKTYILGDFAFMRPDVISFIAKSLNGTKILILGNHDKIITKADETYVDVFESIHDYLEIIVLNTKFVLFHYPLITWNGSGRGAIMLHGHCHGNMNNDPRYPFKLKILDVGVDCHNFRPISARDIISKLANRQPEKYPQQREM